jgi:hypothetical protein
MKQKLTYLLDVNQTLNKEKGELKKMILKCVGHIQSQAREFGDKITELESEIDELLISNKAQGEQLDIHYELHAD